MARGSGVCTEVRPSLHGNHAEYKQKGKLQGEREQNYKNLERSIFENCISDLSQGHPGFLSSLHHELGWSSETFQAKVVREDGKQRKVNLTGISASSIAT